jgi:hypothetical protein
VGLLREDSEIPAQRVAVDGRRGARLTLELRCDVGGAKAGDARLRPQIGRAQQRREDGEER